MTKFAQHQSVACFRMAHFFQTAHNANLKHVLGWHMFQNGTQHTLTLYFKPNVRNLPWRHVFPSIWYIEVFYVEICSSHKWKVNQYMTEDDQFQALPLIGSCFWFILKKKGGEKQIRFCKTCYFCVWQDQCLYTFTNSFSK